MLDPNEMHQAHDVALAAMAEVYAAVHAPHGTYRYLCLAPDGSPFYAHQPTCRVLFGFND